MHQFGTRGTTGKNIRRLFPSCACRSDENTDTYWLRFSYSRSDVLPENWLEGWLSSSAFPEFPAVSAMPNQVVYAFSLRTEGSCPYPLSGEGAVGHLIVISVSLDTGGSLVNRFEELLAIRDESQTHRLVSSPLPGS